MPEPVSVPAPRRYAAFLSYRHADNVETGRRWAEWLHQALETYEVPRDLVGKANVRGGVVPPSLYPVFRDEEELPADADLSQNIRRALEHSDLLIVLCSPRACQSRFVDEEIRCFKELGKSDRILALILDGEPNADDPGKVAAGMRPDMECFPEALRFGVPVPALPGAELGAIAPIDWTHRTEPIAADIRPGNRPEQGYTSAAAYRAALERASGGRPAKEIRQMEREFAAQLELTKLKVAAGALGVSLGELNKRDAAYRAKKLRRLATVLGSLALVAVIAAVVAIFQSVEAGRQRNRAVASRQAADELIGYMQYDLSNTLGTVGRLDLMDGINGRIRRYHDEHPPDDPTDFSTRASAERERAVALSQHAELLMARGQLADALATFQQSAQIREKLAARNPDNLDWQRDLSIAYERLGEAQAAQGVSFAALQNYRAALEIRRRLADREPGNADYQGDLALAYTRRVWRSAGHWRRKARRTPICNAMFRSDSTRSATPRRARASGRAHCRITLPRWPFAGGSPRRTPPTPNGRPICR